MSHLPAERLAALADHDHCPDLAPDEAERAHLALCAECAREVGRYRRLVTMAGAARDADGGAEPLMPWAAVRSALAADGLLRADGGPAGVPDEAGGAAAGAAGVRARPARATPRAMPWAGRVAAGLALVAAGAVAGRATAGGASARARPAARDTLTQVAGAVGGAVGGAAQGVALGTALGTARAASYVVDTAARFVNTAEALASLTSAERQYERAASFLVQHDSSAQPADSTQLYRARLAALDNVMAATREALYDAPHDPLINRYYLATMGAREATLRQLGTSLPQGERISRY